MKASKRHTTIFASIVVLAVVVAFAATKWRDFSFWREQLKERKELRERWGRGKFVPLSENTLGDISSGLQKIISRANTNQWSSTVDETDLLRMITLMIRAFSLEDWAAYREFHFPSGIREQGKFNAERMSIIKRAWQKSNQGAGLSSLDGLTDEDVFLNWGKYRLKSKEFSDCHNCWKGVNIENASVQFVKLPKLPVLTIASYARVFEPLRTTSAFPSIVDYSQLANQGGFAVVAYVRIAVEMRRGQIGFYPVYASFCWVPSVGKWAPLELALPTAEMDLRVWF